MKICGWCSTEKPLAEFHKRGEKYQSVCKMCRKDYDHRYQIANREKRTQQKREYGVKFFEWYTGLKKDKPCTDCGIVYHPAAMQWDHLPGSAKVGCLGNMVSRRNRKAILEEIKKCELVCANCHSVRTWNRQRAVV